MIRIVISIKGFYERYKAIVLGVVYALIVLFVMTMLSSCKTRYVVTTEYVADTTAIKDYQQKVDSLGRVITESVSKSIHKQKMDSLIALKESIEMNAHREGVITHYNYDGSISSKEEYVLDLNSKKDSETEKNVSYQSEYEEGLTLLKDSISSLQKEICERDSIFSHVEKKEVTEIKESKMQRFVNETWLAFALWFLITLIFIARYVWKKLIKKIR